MATLEQLRERTPKGYGLAMVVPLQYDIKQAGDDLLQNGILVLGEASGPLGVLRALEIRSPRIQESLYLEGGEHRLLHLIFLDDVSLQYDLKTYKFTVTKEYPREKN
jgi:hypothetical protein